MPPKKPKSTPAVPSLSPGDFKTIIANASTMRSQALAKMIGTEDRDINASCHYPNIITPTEYHAMYSREGIAARVVDVMPDECWSVAPTVYETEDAENETEFEIRFEELVDKHHLWHYLTRIDRLSGVGRFGILLIGINDGLPLDQPVEGVEAGAPTNKGVTRDILYLRPFDESVVAVASSETDIANARYGLPLYYNVSFQDENGQSLSQKIHWTRALHVADNKEMSEVFGVPRPKKLFNRLLDIRKILSGSGEMFWKGAFPGLSFEVDSDETGGDFDAAALRTEMEAYMNGLQRYLALEGVKAKSLATQVADPQGHLTAQIEYIAISLGIPKRIFEGSERGELASSQDGKTWNKRVMKRQNDYLTPMLVRPFIDRLMAMGVLPYVEEYTVQWTDLMSTTESEKADVAKKWSEAFSKYVAGDVAQMIPVTEFLSIFAGLDDDQIEQIKKSLDDYFKEEDDAVDTEEVEVEVTTTKTEEDEK